MPHAHTRSSVFEGFILDVAEPMNFAENIASTGISHFASFTLLTWKILHRFISNWFWASLILYCYVLGSFLTAQISSHFASVYWQRRDSRMVRNHLDTKQWQRKKGVIQHISHLPISIRLDHWNIAFLCKQRLLDFFMTEPPRCQFYDDWITRPNKLHKLFHAEGNETFNELVPFS